MDVDTSRTFTKEAPVARVQLALNVHDLDGAVDFYSKLFGVEPNKRKPGYANFAVADPPLKLVLFEAPEGAERLNHLGVEVSTTEEVGKAAQRINDAGLATVGQDGTTCCYAVQDKVWVEGPHGPWEWYTVLEDAEAMSCAPEACC
jgi:catechol 2,3-dioxygenase-like lactoylglutathione lyase family enzyme